MDKITSNKNIPSFITYSPLHLPQKFEDNDDFRRELRNKVLSQIQGDPIEIKETADIATLIFFFKYS